MEKCTGLWIDHKRAVIVSLIDGKDVVKQVESGIKGHCHVPGGARTSTPYGPQVGSSESKIEEKFRNHLHNYYKNVFKNNKDSRYFLVFGPGEAKTELKKELLKNHCNDKDINLETADKMTNNQIKSKVKSFFRTKAAQKKQ